MTPPKSRLFVETFTSFRINVGVRVVTLKARVVVSNAIVTAAGNKILPAKRGPVITHPGSPYYITFRGVTTVDR